MEATNLFLQNDQTLYFVYYKKNESRWFRG